MRRKMQNKKTVLFIDEIHRWNKAQQDALLPFVEKGIVTLIGATTENPSFEIEVTDFEKAKHIFRLIEALEDHEDIHDVYTNVKVSDEIMQSL